MLWGQKAVPAKCQTIQVVNVTIKKLATLFAESRVFPAIAPSLLCFQNKLAVNNLLVKIFLNQ
ncbi:MAG TPA: hypothetical protein DDW76_08075 [Cyanobacteria bacterium UBA11369]|nr:hypothetical protein [Cyanobacteria bacterium UBA8553]HAZ45453.1 hypothetical protein [Cyanobacteria bacterium UBA11371]HBE33426.1 hypothetical protein [Cyanobacteria bacterium UBA11368]HBE48739.1 hypothetical protein [Cyanobacteria bacterium UBA11369]